MISFPGKKQNGCIMEIQLLEDRRGLLGTIFKGKREGPGELQVIFTLMSTRILFVKLLSFIRCLSFKYESQYGVCRNGPYQVALISSFGRVTGLQKIDTAGVICLTSVRLLSLKLKQIMQ